MGTRIQNRIKARIIRALHTRLLAWYRQNKRDLPWRRTRDPYAILVSEIMLQQTRVAAVIPYYERWMRTFPTVQALAQAKLDKVLSQWAGLGYYSRARNLHRAAQVIVEKHDARIPADMDALQTLPGVGRYTAGAIASIAYDKPAAILDGNVIRVLSRLFLIRGDTSVTHARNRLWALAEQIIPPSHISDFNQSLMELGALVCLPDEPRCACCPLKWVCRGRLSGNASQLPVLRRRKATRSVRQYALILRRKDKVWLERRMHGELMAGLWGFPRFQTMRAIHQQHPELPARKIGTIVHSVMQQRITVHAMLASRNGEQHAVTTTRLARWIRLRDLRSFALPSADRRLANLISAP